jgi:hypothetical protein
MCKCFVEVNTELFVVIRYLIDIEMLIFGFSLPQYADEIKSAIVDIGSSTCRFGTAGQDVPRHVFRSVYF